MGGITPKVQENSGSTQWVKEMARGSFKNPPKMSTEDRDSAFSMHFKSKVKIIFISPSQESQLAYFTEINLRTRVGVGEGISSTPRTHKYQKRVLSQDEWSLSSVGTAIFPRNFKLDLFHEFAV